jgi:hypothetical protein
MYRSRTANNTDIITGALLISVGTLALVVRLGVLTIALIPDEVMRWWPLLLIVVGVALWAFEHDHREPSHRHREASNVD